MSAYVSLRAKSWIVAISFALTVVVPSTASSAATMAFQNERASAEPFGLVTIALPNEGPLPAKWHTVETAITEDLKVIAACRADRASCASQPALAFLKIVDNATALTGLARVGEINRAFNLGIRAMSDQAQYGVEDLWTSPLATLTTGAGDCEDYAIAKMVALREAGLAADDLRLVILRDTSNGEDHAVVAVRVDSRWRVLDNRIMLMLEDQDVTKLQPMFAFDAEGAKRFVDPSVAVAALTPKVETVAKEIAKEIAKDIAKDAAIETAQKTAQADLPDAEVSTSMIMADIGVAFDAYQFAM